MLESRFVQRTTATWVALLEDAGVPVAPVQSVPEALV